MHVKITRTWSICNLSPWLSGLEEELSFTKVNHRQGYIPQGEQKVSFNRIRMYDVPVEAPTMGVFPAGLYERVIDWLTAHGHTYDVDDRRNLTRLKPMPDFTRVGKLREGQDEALLKLAYADCGIINAATAFGKSFIITQACRMYPTLRFLVTTPRVSVVNSLYDRLVAALGEEQVGRAGGNKDILNRRVMVTTTKSMKKVFPGAVDVLFFDEVHGVGDNEVAIELANYVNCRRFGFTASLHRGDKTEMCIEALFGRVLMEVSYQEAVDMGNVVPIEVHMREVDDFEIPVYNSSYANKRNSYWRNRRRNKIIAEEARKIPDDEQCLVFVETLEHAVYLQKELTDYKIVHFGKPRLEYEAFEWRRLPPEHLTVNAGWVQTGAWTFRRSTPEDPVEEKRYGWVATNMLDKDFKAEAEAAGREVRLLGRVHNYHELEGFPGNEEAGIDPVEPVDVSNVKEGDYYLVRQEEYILDVAKSTLIMTDKEKDEIRKRFESGELKKVIATFTWKEGVDFEQLVHVIRADGSSGEVANTQLPGRISRLYEGKTKGKLIDFMDRFNEWAEARSNKRIAIYRSHQWTIHG